jgi:hypothetical protein
VKEINFGYEDTPIENLEYVTSIVAVTFPEEDRKLLESAGTYEKKVETDDWLECRSNESENSEY